MRRLLSLLRRKREDEETRAEIESHLAMLTDEYASRGMSPAEARRAAVLHFGPVEAAREAVRDQRRLPFVETTWRDVRYGIRSLRRAPVLTAVAVLSLAIGIGANTALFSVADAMLLRELPVSRPHELIEFIRKSPDGAMMTNLPPSVYDSLRGERGAVRGVFAFVEDRLVMRIGSWSQRVTVHAVSPEFFELLGVRPQIGRTDGIVLSHGASSRWFGRDSSAVGQRLQLGPRMFTVAGVMPEGFFGVDRERLPDLWVPLDVVSRGAELWMLGRLTPEVTIEQAQAALEPAFRAALPPEAANQRLLLRSARMGTAGLRWSYWEYSNTLKILIATAGLVLLICCANLANLLLARGAARWREIGIRLSLGATRGRIVRQLLTEHMLLAWAAGALALFVAVAGHRALVPLLLGSPDNSVEFELNARVLLFGAGACIITGLLAGLLPAVRATQPGSAVRLPWARAILAAQVALSVVLLAGTAMLAQSLRNLVREDLGIGRANLVLMTVEPPPDTADLRQFWLTLLDRVGAVPGVQSASLAGNAVLGGGQWSKRVWSNGESMQVAMNVVGPAFFDTTGMPLLRGREFSLRDDAAAPRVAVVNEAFARRFYGTADCIGRSFTDGAKESIEIVGVSANAKPRNPRDAFRPMVYQPLLQSGRRGAMRLHVRVRDAQATEKIVRAIGPTAFVDEVRTLEQVMDRLVRRDRTFAVVAALFAAVAVLLACIGIYGVVAFRAARRTAEIGIRVALGATRGDVLWLIARDSATTIAAGAAIGLPSAVVVAGGLRSMLFGVRPSDPMALAAAVIVLGVTGLAASFLPARRAASVSPLDALRCE